MGNRTLSKLHRIFLFYTLLAVCSLPVAAIEIVPGAQYLFKNNVKYFLGLPPNSVEPVKVDSKDANGINYSFRILAKRGNVIRVERVSYTLDEETQTLRENSHGEFTTMLSNFESNVQEVDLEKTLATALESISEVANIGDPPQLPCVPQGDTPEIVHAPPSEDTASFSFDDRVPGYFDENRYTCNDQNDYLEDASFIAMRYTIKDLQKFPAPMNTPSQAANIITNSPIAECVFRGMQHPVKGHRGNMSCRNGSTFYEQHDACVSVNRVALLSAELEMAAKCLNFNVKEALPLFMHESRLTSNAVSLTGSTGLGQLTRDAIKDINQDWRRAKALKSTEGKPYCQYIKDSLNDEMRPNNKCDRVKAPDNPRKNILYSMVYYKLLREDGYGKYSANRKVDKWISLRKKYTNSPPVSPKLRDQMIQEITQTMYNGGIGDIGNSMDTFMIDRSNWEINSIEEFRRKFARHVIRQEPREYAEKIRKDAKLMESAPGEKKCSL